MIWGYHYFRKHPYRFLALLQVCDLFWGLDGWIHVTAGIAGHLRPSRVTPSHSKRICPTGPWPTITSMETMPKRRIPRVAQRLIFLKKNHIQAFSCFMRCFMGHGDFIVKLWVIGICWDAPLLTVATRMTLHLHSLKLTVRPWKLGHPKGTLSGAKMLVSRRV